MNPPENFAHYPAPKEHISEPYVPKKGDNPVLSGFPLVVASSLYVSSHSVIVIGWGLTNLQRSQCRVCSQTSMA